MTTQANPAAAQIAALVSALQRSEVTISEQELTIIAMSTNLDAAIQTASVFTGFSPYTLQTMANEEQALTPEERLEGSSKSKGAKTGAAGMIQQLDGTLAPANASQVQAGIDNGTLSAAGVDPETGSTVFSFTAPPPPIEEEAEGFAGGFPGTFRPLLDWGSAARQRQQMGRGGGALSTWGPAPLYYEFDAWRLFAGKSPEYIAEVKAALIEAGIIDEAEAGPMGHWRIEDSRNMYNILAEANASGKPWTTIVEEYAAAPDVDKAKAWRAANPFIAPVFKAPDYASLSQAVRGAFAQQIGRDPKDYELALLADQMRADFNAQHGATVSAARAQYEATARAADTGAPQSAGTVQDVDPMARLSETVLSKYGPEIERVEGVQENQLNVGLLMRSLTGMDNLVG